MIGELLAPTGTNSALDTNAFRTLIQQEERNRIAKATIEKYVAKHRKMDVAIGLAGLIPIPGASSIALVAAIDSDFVRSQLRAQGIPPSVIDAVLKVAAEAVA
jgi:hypothetical protein